MALETFAKEFTPDWDAWDDYRNITNIDSIFIETAKGFGYKLAREADSKGVCFHIRKGDDSYTLIKTCEARNKPLDELTVLKEEFFMYHLYKGNTPQIFVDITAQLNSDSYFEDGDDCIKGLGVSCKKLQSDPLVDTIFNMIKDRYKNLDD